MGIGGPQLVGTALPCSGIGSALVAQMLHALRLLKVSGFRPCLVDDTRQDLRVSQHGTGAKVVAVEGLRIAICHEKGTFQGVEQRDFRMFESE